MKKVISLDIGGTNLRAAIINNQYEIEKVIIKDNKTYGDRDAFYRNIISLINELDFEVNEIENICVGLPGKVRSNGKVDELINVGIKDVDIPTLIGSRFDLPVYIKNDAEMALLAESFLGVGKDYNSVYFLTVSTGVGGGFTYKKEAKEIGLEIGHTPFLYKNEYYDFETIASGKGIVNLCKINGLVVDSAIEFFKLVKDEDEKALTILEDWLNLFTDLLQFINKIYQPEVIAFTGGVMKSKDLFFDKLKQKNENLNLTECLYKQNAGLIGGACLGFSKARKD
ncbi:MAG: ROK family protein [Bacilli bacterium]